MPRCASIRIVPPAQFAGDLTMCTFLLKMRELYRWENDLPFTREMPKEAIGDWMNERGRLWEGIETAPYLPLPLPGDGLIQEVDQPVQLLLASDA